MRVIKKGTLRDFWALHKDAEQTLKAWYREARAGDWESPRAVKARYPGASIVSGNRVVFNIAGNKYRLVVKFNYALRVGYVRFIGTHADYSRVDVETV